MTTDHAARILIVDDNPANVRLLERIVAGRGHQHRGTQDPRQALSLFLSEQPDLVLLDLDMPHMDGYAVMTQFKVRIAAGEFLPIVVITADATSAARDRALSEGADDFLTKPFDQREVLLRIDNLLARRRLQQRLADDNTNLEAIVRERTSALRLAQDETLERLGRAAEYRDDDTHEHTVRVGRSSELTALELGWDQAQAALLGKAAPLHDVGKIGTPDAVLLKPGKLTEEEFEIIKQHVTIGARILSGSRSPILQLAEAIALAHHERWNGTGYLGLAGEDIPPAARIVAVADVFDALTHERPYKAAWPLDRALDELAAGRGEHFEPDALDAFLRCTPWQEAASLTPPAR